MASGKHGANAPQPRRPCCRPWRAVGDGVRLTVRLTPKSSADAVGAIVESPEGPHLHVKVRALPADGAANAALEKLVAKWLGLAQRDVSLAGGSKSRLKTLHLSGDPAELYERLGRRLGDPQQQVNRGLRS